LRKLGVAFVAPSLFHYPSTGLPRPPPLFAEQPKRSFCDKLALTHTPRFFFFFSPVPGRQRSIWEATPHFSRCVFDRPVGIASPPGRSEGTTFFTSPALSLPLVSPGTVLASFSFNPFRVFQSCFICRIVCSLFRNLETLTKTAQSSLPRNGTLTQSRHYGCWFRASILSSQVYGPRHFSLFSAGCSIPLSVSSGGKLFASILIGPLYHSCRFFAWPSYSTWLTLRGGGTTPPPPNPPPLLLPPW